MTLIEGNLRILMERCGRNCGVNLVFCLVFIWDLNTLDGCVEPENGCLCLQYTKLVIENLHLNLKHYLSFPHLQ